MLEVVPVSLFQMRDPYKLLIPASTDKVKFKHRTAIVNKARYALSK
jgi:hypothetical protein